MSKKIAQMVENRDITPFMAAIRNFFLHVRRRERMNAADWLSPNRFPDSQSARTQPPPVIPGGVHHQIAANSYFQRDFRRAVQPPTVVADEMKLLGEKSTPKQLGSASFPVPTPGFGLEMKRNKAKELPDMQLVPD